MAIVSTFALFCLPIPYLESLLCVENIDGEIQDLKFLPNGLLLSCSHDKTIRVWEYNNNQQIGEPIEKRDQLRCMDVVTETGTLLIGTNTQAILTHNITDLINFIPEDQESINQLGYDMSDYGSEGDEENKIDYDEDGNEVYRKGHDMDDQDDFDYNGDDIVIQNVMQLMKEQERILEADKAGAAAQYN